MNIAVTGATGFIGTAIVRHLAELGHTCKCWYRPSSQRDHLESTSGIEWVQGALGDQEACMQLLEGADAVVHAGLYRPTQRFRGEEGDLVRYGEQNIVGTLQLIEAARQTNLSKFIFVSTCAVHEVILEDRPLDEAHPTWAKSYYGAHKAALEQFVYACGLIGELDICALRPTGVYGLHHEPSRSKWLPLVRSLVAGDVSAVNEKGGKEVHVKDVAKAAALLLTADGTAGQAYNCYDMYISSQRIAQTVARLTDQELDIAATNTGPRHQIDTSKIRELGMRFGGQDLFESTIAELISLCR